MGVTSKTIENNLERGSVNYSDVSVIISEKRVEELVLGVPREVIHIKVSKGADFFPFGFEQTKEGMKLWYNFVYFPRQSITEIDKLIEMEKGNLKTRLSNSGETKLANKLMEEEVISWGGTEDDKQLNGVQVMKIRLICDGEALSKSQKDLLAKEFKAMGDKIKDTLLLPDCTTTLQIKNVVRKKEK
ncbi:MAG: hypothetical protein ABSD68_03305 [Candidatus Micrarchaeales archaeon]|jgi:hypothetical protein